MFNTERDLLVSKGHEVFRFVKTNEEINGYNIIRKIKAFYQSPFSPQNYRRFLELFTENKPDICHVHNTFPLITPSVYYACRDFNIPVVQTLHNYRLLCSNACFFRNGKICEECKEKSPYHSVRYGCYRNSVLQTFALARIVEKNRKCMTWSSKIDAYIALTDFARRKFIEGGLPGEKIYVKPNFLAEDPGFSDGNDGYFFFAGRLDKTKGVEIMMNALKYGNNFNLLVAGDGPLRNDVSAVIGSIYCGHIEREKMFSTLKRCYAVVFPSLWYEGFPMVIIEAFACGKPVIASRLGAMAEIIEDGRTGLLFEPGNARDLADKMNWALANPLKIREMGRNARREYEEKYTAEKNYGILMDIYEKAKANAGKS